jgi:hypothetical protein
MSRSNAPLALSVVTLTVPGNVQATVSRITEFDDRDFGFNHNQTWASLPLALRGVLQPEAVKGTFRKAPPRVQKCIVALCEFGLLNPRETMRFTDHPGAGLKTVESIDWDPEVRVRVKGSCWYMRGDTPVIPILQPRKVGLEVERLSIYMRLARQAYCQGDWIEADIDLIDLSGDDDPVSACSMSAYDLPEVTDMTVNEYVHTFVEAKKKADQIRKAREKVAVTLPMAELLDIK